MVLDRNDIQEILSLLERWYIEKDFINSKIESEE